MTSNDKCQYMAYTSPACNQQATGMWGTVPVCDKHGFKYPPPPELLELAKNNLEIAFRMFFKGNEGDDPVVKSVRSYDDSTLFCPAGMQRYADWYKDPVTAGHETTISIQSCLRVNDLDFVGDGSHLAYFNMLGLFSFGELSVKDAIDFWLGFITSVNPNKPLQRITIHPEKLEEWSLYYPESLRSIIVPDSECIWSDGKEASGFCTEFYIDGIEIGNIVNTNGTMIDCGFGLERLEHVLLGKPMDSELEGLDRAIRAVMGAGYAPGSKKQGYVLRKLIRRFLDKGGDMDHEYIHQEKERQKRMIETYNKYKDRHIGKPPEWWFDTYGVDVTIL